MALRLDRRVVFCPTPDSVNKWCLREFDSAGSQLGTDQKPYGGLLRFTVTKLALHDEHSVAKKFEGHGGDERKVVQTIDDRRFIKAKLRADGPSLKGQFEQSTYSMFGTGHDVSSIGLQVEMLGSEQEEERFEAFGSVGHSSDLFPHETSDDELFFLMHVRPSRFDRYADAIARGWVDEAVLTVRGVAGFYADRNPFTYETDIKILTNEGGHKVEIPADCDPAIPRLGDVGEWELRLKRRINFHVDESNRAGAQADGPAATFEHVRAKAVRSQLESLLKSDGDGDSEKVPPRTDFERLLESVTKAAAAYAASQKMCSSDFEHGLLSDSIEFCWSLRSAFVAYDEKDLEKRFKIWSHDRDLRRHSIRDKERPFDSSANPFLPFINTSSLEVSVGEYLKLPYRCDVVDHMLVDALIGAELSSFSGLMLNHDHFGLGLPEGSLRTEHVVWSVAKRVGAIGFTLALLLIAYFNWDGSSGAFKTIIGWVLAGIVAVGSLIVLLSLAALPFAWRAQHKKKQKTVSLIQAMSDAYQALESDGPRSASHIRARLDAAVAIGVVWPASVYAVLDDIQKREGWF